MIQPADGAVAYGPAAGDSPVTRDIDGAADDETDGCATPDTNRGDLPSIGMGEAILGIAHREYGESRKASPDRCAHDCTGSHPARRNKARIQCRLRGFACTRCASNFCRCEGAGRRSQMPELVWYGARKRVLPRAPRRAVSCLPACAGRRSGKAEARGDEQAQVIHSEIAAGPTISKPSGVHPGAGASLSWDADGCTSAAARD